MSSAHIALLHLYPHLPSLIYLSVRAELKGSERHLPLGKGLKGA